VAPMHASSTSPISAAGGVFSPVERVEGALDAGVLVICDHASNGLPPEYGDLGLAPASLQRHIAYDIGAAWLVRRLAHLLGSPAVLSTFSRLLIDPNRGADDPTLVMRLSDGAAFTWFHHRPFPFGAIVTIFCFGSATPSPRSALHAHSSRFHCSWWD